MLASLGTMLGGRAGIFNVAQEGVMVPGRVRSASWSRYGRWQTPSAWSRPRSVPSSDWSRGGPRTSGSTSSSSAWRCSSLRPGWRLLFRGGHRRHPDPAAGQHAGGLEGPVPGRHPGHRAGPVRPGRAGVLRVLLSVGLYWLLYRTDLGLELRSVGENPKAADSLGINVARTRIVAATVGSALMALGGAYLPMVYTGTYTDGIVSAGAGWRSRWRSSVAGGRSTSWPERRSSPTMEVLALRVQVAGMAVPTSLSRCCPMSRRCW